nr:hypothetical protein [Nocardia puris]
MRPGLDGVGPGFEHHRGQVVVGEGAGGGESGLPRADDDRVDHE